MNEKPIPPSGEGRRNFYGRQHGKTLRDRHKLFLAEDLQRLAPGNISLASNPERRALDVKKQFGTRPVWLEVGFGGGEHLVHQAVQNPDVAIIGCEPFINGVAMLLGKIRDAAATNISVYPGDVRDLFDVLPAASVSRAFLLYPDPWPKQRHVSRRFINATYLKPLAHVLKPGAIFRVATDISDYAKRASAVVPDFGFELMSQDPQPWADWTTTRYEQKALREGRTPAYLTFRRL
ncbi:MAG: tRNA (guanine(46)-N(7))-methyltransferase TrmB [Paracoccaceae bacterium]